MEHIEVCKECGSEEVARCKWVNVNSNYIYSEDSGTTLEWCFDCKDSTDIIDKEDYNYGVGVDIPDDLKANFRDYEVDAGNFNDTLRLHELLKGRHPKLDVDELWDICVNWTGYKE